MPNKYSVSIVNYYNTTPFLYGIEHSGIELPIDLQLDIPSMCAHKLKNNLVDIGLVPIAILPELKEYYLITDYCIGAKGKVDSVKLFSQKPLEELTHVWLDYQSRTSVTLVQVLNHYFWKKNIQFIPAEQGFENKITDTTGAVIIGDRTFGLNQYPYQYDLAEEWQKYTGMPFVFACWVSNKPVNPSFESKFNQVLNFGINQIKEAVLKSPKNIPGFDAFDYLKNKISYELDFSKREAMNKFLDLLKNMQ